MKINMAEQVDTAPHFQIEDWEGNRIEPGQKYRGDVHVFLHCTMCEERIREVGVDERVSVNRAYFCEACDPGVVVMNPVR